MENLLAIGTVVYLKKGIKKIMIIGRMVVREVDKQEKYNDYVGVVYPEGLIGKDLFFFNKESIDRVVYEGYENEDEKVLKDRINKWTLETNIEKAVIKEE